MRSSRLLGVAWVARAALVSAPILAFSCSSKDDAGANPGADAGGAFTARFELPKTGAPDILAVPFPSDLMLAADGTIALTAGTPEAPRGLDRIVPRNKGAKFVQDALARTRGFGSYAGAIFEVTGGAPDMTKLPTGKVGDCTTKDSRVFYVDLDDGKALECMAGYNDDALFGEEGGDGNPLARVMVVRTARGVVIPEGHHVAVLLTSGVVTKDGTPLAASPQLAAIRDGQRDGDNERLYGAAIDAAALKIGFDEKRVVAAAVYTTGHVGDEIRSARELARATPVPTLKWTEADVAPVKPAKFTATTPLPAGWTATLDDLLGTPNKMSDGTDDPDWGGDNPGAPHDAIGAMGVASFDAPSFLVPEGDYGDPDHGTFFHDAAGKVAIDPKQPTAKIWVTFMVPKGAMPEKGWPVVVYQHGMGGQRGDALSMANTYARHGWATASIEVVLQGTRGLDAVPRGDKANDYKRSTSKYAGPDGFSDKSSSDGSNYAPTDLFGDLYRIAALRDQFRQSAIDHTTLLRVLQSSPKLDGLADGGVTPLIDGTKVAYSGVSLGGIIGSITAAIEPNHAAYFLDVPGGGLFVDLASSSPGIYALLHTAAALFFGYNKAQVPWSHPLVQLMQHVVDGMDPVALGGTVTNPVAIAGVTPKPRNVLLVEDLADELVANPATEALARSMGVPIVTPHAPQLFATLKEIDGASIHDVPLAGTTGVLVQVYPASHGGELVEKHGRRTHAVPYGQFGDPQQDPFPTLATPATFDNPYLELQALATKFLGDALDAKVPTLTWTKAPTSP